MQRGALFCSLLFAIVCNFKADQSLPKCLPKDILNRRESCRNVINIRKRCHYKGKLIFACAKQGENNDVGVVCIGGKCFEHFNVYLDWSQAFQFCVNNVSQPNSTISVITSAFENNAIIIFADYDWIGLHQVGDFAPKWVWADGTPLTYTNWGPNQPQEGHRCAQICHFDFSDQSCVKGKWISVNCVEETNVSCQYPDPGNGTTTAATAP